MMELNSQKRKWIKVIEKRIIHLHNRINGAKGKGKNSLSFDREECYALEWMLSLVLVQMDKEENENKS